jgi:hypothetical protein
VFTYPQNLVGFCVTHCWKQRRMRHLSPQRGEINFLGEEERERAAFRQSETRFRSFPHVSRPLLHPLVRSFGIQISSNHSSDSLHVWSFLCLHPRLPLRIVACGGHRLLMRVALPLNDSFKIFSSRVALEGWL